MSISVLYIILYPGCGITCLTWLWLHLGYYFLLFACWMIHCSVLSMLVTFLHEMP